MVMPVNMEEKVMQLHGIVLFDGICNLCNGLVRFIIKRDNASYFLFGSLQSDVAKELLNGYKLNSEIAETVVLIENDKVYTSSTAVLRILKKMPYFQLLYVFILIPEFIRNPVYKFIAKHRYRVFGKQDSCMIPHPGISNRFIN